MTLRERRWIHITQERGEWVVSAPLRHLILSGRRIVLIVHGYDNDPNDAGRSYELFYKELKKFIWPHLFEHIWEVYWPGYWPRRPYKIEPFAKLSYAKQARDAPSIGEALANALQLLFDTHGLFAPEILFIAHSLGCRVVLEVLKHLAASDGISVPGICLMAAAVPTSMVSPDAPLRRAAEYAQRRYILYSWADKVLHPYFCLGEFVAAFGRSWPEAVGRFGNPREFWDRRFENVVNTGLDHGDYYYGRSKDKPLSDNQTAPTIARMFGRALPMYPRENDPYVIKWELPSAATPRIHRTAERPNIL